MGGLRAFRPSSWVAFKGRRLRPGGAGLSRRRTHVGTDAPAPVPTRLTSTANRRRGKSARAPPAHVQREAPYTTPARKRSFRAERRHPSFKGCRGLADRDFVATDVAVTPA